MARRSEGEARVAVMTGATVAERSSLIRAERAARAQRLGDGRDLNMGQRAVAGDVATYVTLLFSPEVGIGGEKGPLRDAGWMGRTESPRGMCGPS